MSNILIKILRTARTGVSNSCRIRRWCGVLLVPLLGAVTTMGTSWVAVAVLDPMSGNCSSVREGPTRRMGDVTESGVAGCNLTCWTQGPVTLLVWRQQGDQYALGLEAPNIGPAPDWSIRHERGAAEAIEAKSKWVVFDRTKLLGEGRGFVCELASGWPKPALVARFYGAPASLEARFLCTGGIPLPAWSVPPKPGVVRSSLTFKNWPDYQPRALPLSPYWPGFLTNTAFYAAPWLVIVVIAPAMRRGYRARRGLCTGCGYSMRGLPGGSRCPECGCEGASLDTVLP